MSSPTLADHRATGNASHVGAGFTGRLGVARSVATWSNWAAGIGAPGHERRRQRG